MKFIVILAVAAALMLPSAAMAQSSTCQSYNPQLCSEVNDGSTSTLSSSTSGTLPFTGVDVALLAAGGITLLGAGFVVRRLSRRLD
jgi:hypothetical protein